MKHNILRTMMAFLACMASLNAMAYDAYIGGIYYDFSGTNATVTYRRYITAYSGVVTIPESVTSGGVTYTVTGIGDNAFDGCTDLTSIQIPNSVTAIGMRAFSSCSGLTSLSIPENVKTIGNSAFSGCTGLTSISIPNGVDVINSSLFYKCTGLTSVAIPNSVKTIKNGAFQGCTGLTSIPIPNSVTDIEWSAFAGCSSLTSITIPESVTTIGRGVFSGCNELASIKVNDGNPIYDSRDNCNAIIVTASNTILVGCQSSVIPNSVVAIGNSAFYNCTNLINITIPNSVTAIEESAFSGCSSLTSINIPDEVKTIGAGAFVGCSSLTSITLPKAITAIEQGTFESCTSLSSITIPPSVTRIEGTAFFGCKSLKAITIPKSVVSIAAKGDGGTFIYCESLESIVVEDGNPTYDSRDNCNAIIETSTNKLLVGCNGTSLPSSVTAIGDFAFWGSALASFAIPNTVTEIGYGAFMDCNSLISLSVDVPSIGESAFFSIPNLEQLNLGRSVASIGNRAFENCSSLSSLIIPGNVAYMGAEAFRGTNITSVEFLHTKEQLDALNWATTNTKDFKGPYETTLKFSADVMGKVDVSYFQNERQDGFHYWANSNKACFSEIEGSAFYVKVTNNGNVTWVPIQGTLDGNNLDINYSSSIDKETVGDLDLSQVNTKSDGSGKQLTVTNIASGAFRGCNGLTSVIIGDGVTTIGREAFAECGGLKSAVIGSGLTTISRELFRGCTSLTSVTIPNSVTTIDIGAFMETGLTSVSIPSGVSKIEKETFWHCSDLAFVAIPESVIDVDGYAFSGCSKLTVVMPQQLSYLGRDAVKNVKCVVFTSTTPPGMEDGLSASTINQVVVPKRALDTYTAKFKTLTNTSVSSFVGYETSPVEVSVEGTAVTSCKVKFTSYVLDNGEYGSYEEESTLYGLTPDASTEYSWTLEDGNQIVYRNLVTSPLTLEPQATQAASDTKAIISATTNGADDGLRFGFEWRRYDAPELVPSTVVTCPVYDGVIAGTLNGLSANTYYMYRPFYKSDAGEVYYGEWMAFGTADAYVYFEPVVHTVEAQDVSENTATLTGMVVSGSDDVIEQGFEYWTSQGGNGAPAHAPQNVQTVTASGTVMTVTLTGLQSGTTYYYRTYVKTAKDVTYGEEYSFTTPGTTGISELSCDSLSEPQPFNVYSLSGTMVRHHATSLEGLPRGVYIVNRRKVFVK